MAGDLLSLWLGDGGTISQSGLKARAGIIMEIRYIICN